MANQFFENSYLVHYYETDAHKQLRVTSLMNYFEEVALLQSESKKVGLDYYQKNNVAWMLHKWDINLHRSPVFGQQILIRTLPVSIAGFMGFRKFWVFDENGETLVTADSAWLFINTQNKRPLRISDDMKHAYGHFDQPESRLEIPEIPAISHTDFSNEFKVRHADIDINLHVNNVRYVDWALEAVPVEILRSMMLSAIRIIFRKETVYGQKINSQVQLINQADSVKCIHNIVDEQGRDVCGLLTTWVPVS